jgi:hypothetical protein
LRRAPRKSLSGRTSCAYVEQRRGRSASIFFFGSRAVTKCKPSRGLQFARRFGDDVRRGRWIDRQALEPRAPCQVIHCLRQRISRQIRSANREINASKRSSGFRYEGGLRAHGFKGRRRAARPHGQAPVIGRAHRPPIQRIRSSQPDRANA